MQREARLEDWRDELSAMDATLLVETLHGQEAEAAKGQNLADGELRPEDVDLKQIQSERDTLARRIDMERSAIRDALGSSRADARSFRYDEWDYLNRRYLPRWCRVFEQRLAPDLEADLGVLQAVIRAHRSGVQKRLEQIKPLGYQRVFRVADGDELDFNAVIQARQDIRAGLSPDERVYSRRDRVHRDVCAVFLVDLSASTDDPVEAPPPAPAPDDDHDSFLWGRASAPAKEIAPTETEQGADAEPRRIIDVQREAMLVMSAALEQLGDSYGVYGFSGYGRDCVELFVAKEPGERFSRNTLAAIAGMKPKRSTRMGPAIRHSVRKLLDSGNALKVLLIISDGFPQDCDYGPERGEHEYGVQDTARALQEAQDKGVETFCVTVDRSGHDYLKRMCPAARYLVIEEIEDLPEQLSKVYQVLTG
jgi:nitric oxide reductase activation protein